jgi:hypothetical protein
MRNAVRLVFLAAVSLLTTFAGAAAVAADPETQPVQETKDVRWSINGEVRLRPEYRDNWDLDSGADDDMRQAFMRLRLGFAVDIKEDYRVFVQAQDSREAGIEASTASNEKNLDLHQGYLEIRNMGVKGLGLIAGRQELKYGDERLIGPYGWNNVGRAFDGAKIRYARERWWIDGIVAQVSRNAVATFGPTEGSDLYGAYFSTSPNKRAAYEAYWLTFADHVAAPGENADPNDPSTWSNDTYIHAFGGRAKDTFGVVDFTVEAAIEVGNFRGDDLTAFAAGGQVGLTYGERPFWRPFFGYDFATGDQDPFDGEREEFFNFFPTNHIHYGYMDLFGWRNIRSPYFGVAVFRGKHFGQAKYHIFSLQRAAGPWKDAAGAVLGFDATGGSGTSVGNEIDLTYRYAWLEKAGVEVGLSRFNPDQFAQATRGSDSQPWGYVMLTFAF